MLRLRAGTVIINDCNLVVRSRQQGHFDFSDLILETRCCERESLQGHKQANTEHNDTGRAKPPNADTSHSHLFTAFTVTCSGDCTTIYVQFYVIRSKNRLEAVLEISQINVFTDISPTSSPQQPLLTRSYLTSSRARERGHVQAAFTVLHFNDWLHCCRQWRKPPALGNANACCWDANTQWLARAHTHTNTHTVHIVILHIHTQCHQSTTQANWHVHTHTHTHVCYSCTAKSSTIRPARYNGVVWMGSNNGALWHLNRARWWVSQEAE